MATARDINSKVKGWGADLDPKNRPAVPKEKTPPEGTGAHWQVPERQKPKVKILKSVEKKELTPVFGTSCPPKGVSGIIREYAYRLREGNNAHWMLLSFADRVDAIESDMADFVRGRFHNPLSERGLNTEWEYQGWRSRVGQNRADVRRWKNEIFLFVGLGASLLLWRQLFSSKSK